MVGAGAAFWGAAMTYFIITGGVTGAITGGGALVGPAAVITAIRPPKQDIGSPRRRGDAVVLPRRWIYGYLLGLGMLLLGMGLTALSVLDVDDSSSSRYAPEALVVVGIPLAVAGVLIVCGALFPRGVVRLSATELSYAPVFGRTQRRAWSDIRSTPRYDYSGIVIPGRRHKTIPAGSQAWTVHSVVAVIDRFRTASEEERRFMIETTDVLSSSHR